MTQHVKETMTKKHSTWLNSSRLVWTKADLSTPESAKAMLVELAYVLDLTSKIKQSILSDIALTQPALN